MNPYIDNYDPSIDFKTLDNNNVEIYFSKFGLVTINNSAQAIDRNC